MKPVAVFVVAMSFYGPVTYGQSKENYRQFDEGFDQNGFGFGPVFQGTDGLSMYYDRNYHNVSKQVHIQYEITRGESKTVLGVPVAEVQQTSLHGSLRHVVNSGWYLGGVLGWYNTTLDVHQSGLDSKTPDHDLFFYNRGVLVGPEIGWQGNDFYYFTVGLRLLGRHKLAEHYKPDEIYDVSNHRSKAAEMWESGKQYSAIYLGFGWYLNSRADVSKAESLPSNNSDAAIIEKAKKCQEKGGVWVNDICRIEIQ